MIVVKVGGSTGVDLGAVCQDVAELLKAGTTRAEAGSGVSRSSPQGNGGLVLVHGGSHETNVISEKLGHAPRFVTSVSGHVSRYTDREALDIFAMVVAGRVNKLLVEQLQRLRVNALGLSGVDGRLLLAKRKSTLRVVENGKTIVLRGDYSGQIEGVNTSLLQLLLEAGYVPVVAPLAISPEGEVLNVDGDRAAAAVGAALCADTVVILSNVAGLLRNFPDESSLIPHVPLSRAEEYMERYAQGRMKKKVLGAIEALQGGARRVIIADGRVEHPISRALAGQGTVISPDATADGLAQFERR
jgi:acetylglutamate/LysW-gamma-L-alpha-aminoadipate kinase